MKLKQLFIKQNGDVLVIFALLFTVLVGFVSLSADLGLVYMQRAEMLEIAQLMRDTRFDLEAGNAELTHSGTPGELMFTKMNEIARLNDFNGTVQIIYYEYETSSYSRRYKVRINLYDTYQYTTLRLLGFDELKTNCCGQAFL